MQVPSSSRPYDSIAERSVPVGLGGSKNGVYADKAHCQMSSVTVGFAVGIMTDSFEGSNAITLMARAERRMNVFMTIKECEIVTSE